MEEFKNLTYLKVREVVFNRGNEIAIRTGAGAFVLPTDDEGGEFLSMLVLKRCHDRLSKGCLHRLQLSMNILR